MVKKKAVKKKPATPKGTSSPTKPPGLSPVAIGIGDPDPTPPAEPDPTLPTEEELAKLPPRACVAYAARCARRVQPLFDLPVGHPDRIKHLQAVEDAITLAAAGSASVIDIEAGQDTYVAACAARDSDATLNARGGAADAAIRALVVAANAADAGAADAAYAANAAANAVYTRGDLLRFITQARFDYGILLALHLDPDDFVDASETGPMKKLWGKERPPEWYLAGREKLQHLGILPDPNAPPPIPESADVEAARRPPAMERQIDEDSREIESLWQRLAKASQEKETLSQKIDELQDKLRQRSEMTPAEESQLRAELATIEKQRDSIRQEHDELRREKNKQLDELTVKNRTLMAELDAARIRNEDESVQGPLYYVRAFFKVKNVFQLVTLCLLGGLVLINLFAISEVYERQALDRWLRTRIDELRDAGLNAPPVQSAPNQSSVLQNRRDVESLRARLQILSSTGASAREGTITGLRDTLSRQQLSGASSTPAVFSPAPSPTRTWAEWIGGLDWLSYRSSDLLLSLVVLFSGTVGAVITAIRKDRKVNLRDLGQGLAAGFATFLVVRGGKSILLLEADPMLLVNPYNTAFFGLLAGMFTELVYELLTDYAEELVRRLKMKNPVEKNSLIKPDGEIPPPANV